MKSEGKSGSLKDPIQRLKALKSSNLPFSKKVAELRSILRNLPNLQVQIDLSQSFDTIAGYADEATQHRKEYDRLYAKKGKNSLEFDRMSEALQDYNVSVEKAKSEFESLIIGAIASFDKVGSLSSESQYRVSLTRIREIRRKLAKDGGRLRRKYEAMLLEVDFLRSLRREVVEQANLDRLRGDLSELVTLLESYWGTTVFIPDGDALRIDQLTRRVDNYTINYSMEPEDEEALLRVEDFRDARENIRKSIKEGFFAVTNRLGISKTLSVGGALRGVANVGRAARGTVRFFGRELPSYLKQGRSLLRTAPKAIGQLARAAVRIPLRTIRGLGGMSGRRTYSDQDFSEIDLEEATAGRTSSSKGAKKPMPSSSSSYTSASGYSSIPPEFSEPHTSIPPEFSEPHNEESLNSGGSSTYGLHSMMGRLSKQMGEGFLTLQELILRCCCKSKTHEPPEYAKYDFDLDPRTGKLTYKDQPRIGYANQGAPLLPGSELADIERDSEEDLLKRIASALEKIKDNDGKTPEKEKSFLGTLLGKLTSFGGSLLSIAAFIPGIGTAIRVLKALKNVAFGGYKLLAPLLAAGLSTSAKIGKSVYDMLTDFDYTKNSKGMGKFLGRLSIAATPLMIMAAITDWAKDASIKDANGNLTGTGSFLDGVGTALGNKSLAALPSLSPDQKAIDDLEATKSVLPDFMNTSRNALHKKYTEQISRNQSFSPELASKINERLGISVPSSQIVARHSTPLGNLDYNAKSPDSPASTYGASPSKKSASGLYTLRGNSNVSGLQPGFKSKFDAMVAEYYALGGKHPVNVNRAFSTYEEQKSIYEKYGPGKAAPPGRSVHEYGMGIDIDSAAANEMASMGLLDKYGLSRPVRGEPWHIQPKGSSVDLAKAGIYSADAAVNQGFMEASGKGTSGGEFLPSIGSPKQSATSPSTEVSRQGPSSVPPSNAAYDPSPGLTYPPREGAPNNDGLRPKYKRQPSSGSPHGLSSIPSFSYQDSGMFAFNLGAL